MHIGVPDMLVRFLRTCKGKLGSPRLKSSLPVLTAAILLVAAIGAVFILRERKLTPEAIAGISLSAVTTDALGVAPDSAFLLRSRSGITAEAVRDHLSVSPESAFRVTSKGSDAVEIRFDEPLKGGSVYRFRFSAEDIPSGTAAHADETLEGDALSWAFQTRKVFEIEKTLPADKATGVPTNSGIEVTFSDERFQGAEDAFHIDPSVKGKFERHKKMLVFVPESLSPKTLYTVTIDAGVGVDGSDEKISRSKTFRFETGSADPADSAKELLFSDGWYFSTAAYQFGNGERPALSVTASGFDSDPSSVDVVAYRFPDEDAYLSALTMRGTVPAWSRYARSAFRTDASGLQKAVSFHANLESAGWKRYFAFPDTLPEGYYLVEAESSGAKAQGFVQVTDLSAYVSVSDTETLVWTNDTGNRSPIANAGVEAVIGNRRESIEGKTDDRGLMTVRTPDFLKNNGGETAFLHVSSADGKSAIVPAESNSNLSDGASPRNAGYWSYLYLDRDTYLPTDTLAFWGVVRERDRSDAKKLGLKVVIDGTERKVETSDWGTFIGESPLRDIPVGYYSANVFLDGDDPETATPVATASFGVETYVKPAYKITVVPEKRASIGKVRYSAKAEFFDGTPVPGARLSGGGETAVTDGEGRASFEETIDVDGPTSRWISVTPGSGEEGEIEGGTSVAVFPSSVALSTDEKRDGLSQHVDLSVFRIDFDKAERLGVDDPYGSWVYSAENKYAGEPVSGAAVTVRVKETSYERKEDGEYYDFIEKKTVKRYKYEEKSKELPDRELTAGNDGKVGIDFSLEDRKAYDVIFETKDGEGRKTILSKYYYGYASSEEPDFVLSSGEESGHRYRLDEGASAVFAKSDGSAIPSGGKFLFYRAQRGIREAAIQDDPTYRFSYGEADIPNVEVRGVMYTGKTYIERTTGFSYDTEERKLSISVSADKDSYRPGDTVNLGVSVEDAQGNGEQAKVNLSAVDEAQLAIAPHSPQIATDWAGIYRPVGSGIIAAYASHQYPVARNLAERGGCFLAGTRVRMADGSEKSIESVAVGDSVATRADESDPTLRDGSVAETFRHEVDGYLVIDGSLRVTPEHAVFANGRWATAGELRVGDSLLGIDNGWRRISSIERRDERVTVYNLSVGTYHTYFADGNYVHNSKGREVFLDRVLFTEIETDRNGEGKASFSVPDNLTGWRVAAQALTDNLRVGQDERLSVPVSLPFFVLPSLGDTFVAGDTPTVPLRAFGNGLADGDPVEFSVVSDSLGLHATISGAAFRPSEIAFPSLPEGTHEITFSAKSKGNEDSVKRTIRVVPDGVWHAETASFPVSSGTDFRPGQTGRTTILFGERGMSTALSELWELATNGSARFDGVAAGADAGRILNFRFDGKLNLPSSGDFDPFADGSKGWKLLPYGDADLYATAMSELLGSESPLPASDAELLRETLENPASSRESVATALAGLAARNEPVLIDTDRLLAEPDLSVREKLLLGVAEAALGNGERAKRVLYETLGDTGGNSVELSVPGGKSSVDTVRDTALAAIVAAMTGTPEADRLFAYVAEHPTSEDPLFLERMAFLDAKFRHVPKKGSVSVAYTLNGKREERMIDRGETFSLSLLPDEVRDLRIEGVDGDVGATVVRTVGAKSGSGNDLSAKLDRTYKVSGRPVNELRPGDLVTVELSHSVDDPASLGEGCLSVVDTLPAGLKPVTSWAMMRGQSVGNDISYPYGIDGQRVKFCVAKEEKRPIRYMARVASKGGFTAPGTLMETEDGSRFKASPSSKVVVK